MQLGDARTGKLADNIAGFGRALRRAGVRVDSARIALATEAATLVGLERREDLGAALEAVMVGREQDRLVFRELFDAFFRDPGMAQKLLAQMLPQGEGKAEPVKRRPRVQEALAPQRAGQGRPRKPDQEVRFDATMTASELQRLRHADFNGLSADEYRLVVVMFYFEHCSYKQIADRLELPIGTVMSRLARAKQRLRLELSEKETRAVRLAERAAAKPTERVRSGPITEPER